MTLALIFPGQGSQHVGMAAALAARYPEAARVLAEADEILGFPLSRLMREGPDEELTETRNSQPALLAHSVAALRAAGDRLAGASIAAGHSLGEFSAYVAAGTLSYEDALRTVRLRGELMSRAGTERPGSMAAVLGLADEVVEAVCARVTTGVCQPANFNAEGQVVISGDVAGVEEGTALAKAAGAKRVVPLKTSGAFHSSLMEPAVEGLRAHLAGVRFDDPAFPVVSNVTAELVKSGEAARELLVLQLTSPVRWRLSVAAMVTRGVDRFVEVGPGKVLATMNKRNAPGVASMGLGEPGDFTALEDA
jgi:[acyl-carrier-protein] S-malonyltransferase